MQLRENILNQIEEFLTAEYLSTANTCFFMQSIRILLEIDNSKKKYNVTQHYCNWLAHKQLEHSNSPIIIQEIANSFGDYTSKNHLIEKINEAVSLKKLIVELREILWLNIPNKLKLSQMDFEEYWVNFLQIILKQLLFRPIKLQKDIKLSNVQLSIYGLQLVIDKEHFNIELLSKELENKNKRILINIALFRDFGM